jgi:hypothetical protein
MAYTEPKPKTKAKGKMAEARGRGSPCDGSYPMRRRNCRHVGLQAGSERLPGAHLRKPQRLSEHLAPVGQLQRARSSILWRPEHFLCPVFTLDD